MASYENAAAAGPDSRAAAATFLAGAVKQAHCNKWTAISLVKCTNMIHSALEYFTKICRKLNMTPATICLFCSVCAFLATAVKQAPQFAGTFH
jgi:hypothetical protein